MTRKQIEEYISKIDQEKIQKYSTYWESIAPRNDQEYYLRWIFSFLSVHTSWRKNVDSYLLLSQEDWEEDKNQLSSLIIKSGVGLQTLRTKGIWKFHNEFWANPKEWYYKEGESWIQCRDRLMEKCFGLGLAKTAFALEMAYPKSCGVVCVDTHIIQMYGKKPNKISEKTYRSIENHWVKVCKKYNVPSPIARHIYWDEKQLRNDTTYWSHVFEEPKSNEGRSTSSNYKNISMQLPSVSYTSYGELPSRQGESGSISTDGIYVSGDAIG